MIYILEDDNSIRELVVYTLNSQGLEALGFGRPKEFWDGISKKPPELIILDIMLPEEDGLSILKKLRASEKTIKMPVIMLTAKGSEYDKVIGLDAGADDYVTKPFGMMELIARVKALLRRAEGVKEEEEKEYRLEALYVSPLKHIVKSEGHDVVLTLKEFELLCLLLENKGVVLSRDQILNKIWGYDFDGENRTVDVHIRTLRQKLGVSGEYIQTIRGMGYKIGGAK